MNVISQSLLNQNITRIKVGKDNHGNAPRLWKKVHDEMLKNCKSKGYVCSYVTARQYLNNLTKQKDEIGNNRDGILETPDVKIGMITMLLDIYTHWTGRNTTLRNSATQINVDMEDVHGTNSDSAKAFGAIEYNDQELTTLDNLDSGVLHISKERSYIDNRTRDPKKSFRMRQ